ncbi:LytR C-terminal domain-containing protein [Intrasporangium calvum]|uniref:LytR C-terminal domain-containing protein n=1 Tax=Intrasporangium calvum TaxID=53358 RepID=UPI000DF625D3|nr:LytR C-terminal domain-containing protein [Intrasporangium calvum]AXG12239.1 LytR family transcriptional regulator [Intrasporangium calvum]
MSLVEDAEALEFRARRRRRATVTLAVLLLGLAGAFYYASTYFRDTAPKPGPCTTEVAEVPLTPADVTINVYNATSRSGLALTTSRRAVDRGFRIAKVANDPLKKTIKESAHIRYGTDGEESARLLAQHIKGARLVKDKRKGDTVDLVLGNAWKGFGPAPTPTAPGPTLPPCPTVTVEG